jgi:type IV pilus assembly protein PilN
LIRINLLPKNLRKRVEPGWWKLLAAGVPLLAVLVAGALQFSAQNQLVQLQAEVESKTSQFQAIQPQLAERTQLLRDQADLTAIITVAKQLEATSVGWSRDLERFTARIPDLGGGSTVSLQSLSMKPYTGGASAASPGTSAAYAGKPIVKEFNLRGSARSSQALKDFIGSFETNSDTAINFNNANKDIKTGDWTFDSTVGLTQETTLAAVPSTTGDSAADPNAITPITPDTGATPAPATGGN